MSITISGQAFLHFMANHFSHVCFGEEFQMFPQSATSPPIGIYRNKATAFTLLFVYIRNKTGKGTARGCQNIMGFSGGEDEQIKVCL
jgi:hypothetical protein